MLVDVARIWTTSARRLSTVNTPWRSAIQEKNASVNAFVSIRDSVNASSKISLLHDVSIAVKDNICTSDMPTTCSSNMLEGFVSPFDATVVRLLRNAGADILGKTNCDEFGMGSLNIHSSHGPVINPFQHPSSSSPWTDREQRAAGGSSGGSAAAVAAGMCDAALSTDTGGSTRLPASYCGVVGLKPSYGLISRWGVVSYADSLDCVGVMSKNIEGVRRVFSTLNVYDEQDPTSVSPQIRHEASEIAQSTLQHWSKSSTGSLEGLRIGIPHEYFPAEISPSIISPIRRTIAGLTSLGATVVPVSLPSTPYALSAYYVLASAEASSNLARYDGVQYGMQVKPPPGSDLTKTSRIYAHTRSRGFGREVRKRILLGTYSLTADAFDNYFLQALRVRQLVRNDFDRVFRAKNVLSAPYETREDGVDVLLHPSAIRTAPRLDSIGDASALDAYVQDVLTVPASLAGLPSLSVPVEQSIEEDGGDGWPVGVSVVGQWGCDEVVLRVGEMLGTLGTMK